MTVMEVTRSVTAGVAALSPRSRVAVVVGAILLGAGVGRMGTGVVRTVARASIPTFGLACTLYWLIQHATRKPLPKPALIPLQQERNVVDDHSFEQALQGRVDFHVQGAPLQQTPLDAGVVVFYSDRVRRHNNEDDVPPAPPSRDNRPTIVSQREPVTPTNRLNLTRELTFQVGLHR